MKFSSIVGHLRFALPQLAEICWYIALPWCFSFAKLTNGHISVVSGLQESTVLPILFQWALFLDAILVCTYFRSYFSFWWLDWFFFLPILFDKECKFYFRKAPIWQIFVQAIFKLRLLPMQNLNLNKPLVIQNFAFLNISSIISKKRGATQESFLFAQLRWKHRFLANNCFSKYN